MKRTFAYLVISLFLLSIVSAQPDSVLGRTGGSLSDDMKQVRAEVKDNIQEKGLDIKEQIKEGVKAVKEGDMPKEDKIKNIQQVREMNMEEFRNFQKEQLQTAAGKCNKEINSELCQKNIQERLKLVGKLSEKGLNSLQKVEERKLEKLNELKELKNDPNLGKYKENQEFKARQITKEKLQNAKEKYKESKEKYIEARNRYNESQQKFNEVKARVKECEGNEDAECNQVREEIKENAKEFLLNTAGNILEHLNKVKANVESNEDLSEEEAKEIIADVDLMISEIEDAKSVIESSEDKEQIIEASKTIKKAWLRIKERLAVQTGKITASKIGGVIIKVKSLEAKLERVLSRMEEQSIDTTSIQSLVDEFNAKTDEAKLSYEQALDKFKEAAASDDLETSKTLAKEGHNLLKEAQNSLQGSQKLLRSILLNIKQAGGEDELNAPEDQAEQEAASDLTTEPAEAEASA
ncbi:MAG: hypothetical protein KKC75_02810 [Nanoarchaeota archaeon]|nr:hypothetical protein [Nanoarchaeota archaeon]MBU1005759.1 hypothetical protein [Nanoarchaeota archaeon]MBU1946630.1 hypothetical protein [Nanoarchaeota archaeon]